MAQVRRITTLRYCTYCKDTTTQTQIDGDKEWWCKKCGKPLMHLSINDRPQPPDHVK